MKIETRNLCEAVLGWLARWGASRSGGWLETELRRDLKHKGARATDGFGPLVAGADVLEVDPPVASITDLLPVAVGRLASRAGVSREELARSFISGGIAGSTPVVSGTALPHARLPRVREPVLLVARSRRGVKLPSTERRPRPTRTAHAVFFLVGSQHEPRRHLRLLAELAARADEPTFLRRFVQIECAEALPQVILETRRRYPSQYPRRPARAIAEQ